MNEMNKIARCVLATLALSIAAWADQSPDLIRSLCVTQNESRLLTMSFSLTEAAVPS